MKFYPETHVKSPMAEKDEPKELSFITISELHFPKNTATFYLFRKTKQNKTNNGLTYLKGNQGTRAFKNFF